MKLKINILLLLFLTCCAAFGAPRYAPVQYNRDTFIFSPLTVLSSNFHGVGAVSITVNSNGLYFTLGTNTGEANFGSNHSVAGGTTNFNIFDNKYGEYLAFWGIQAGSNVVIYQNASNIVINALPGGGSAGTVASYNPGQFSTNNATLTITNEVNLTNINHYQNFSNFANMHISGDIDFVDSINAVGSIQGNTLQVVNTIRGRSLLVTNNADIGGTGMIGSDLFVTGRLFALELTPERLLASSANSEVVETTVTTAQIQYLDISGSLTNLLAQKLDKTSGVGSNLVFLGGTIVMNHITHSNLTAGNVMVVGPTKQITNHGSLKFAELFNGLADGHRLAYVAAMGLYSNVPPGSGSGDVIGPSSSEDNSFPRFDGTSGDQLQVSSLYMGDLGGLSVSNKPGIATNFFQVLGTNGTVVFSVASNNVMTLRGVPGAEPSSLTLMETSETSGLTIQAPINMNDDVTIIFDLGDLPVAGEVLGIHSQVGDITTITNIPAASGSGTVTHTSGALTLDLPLLGNGSDDIKSSSVANFLSVLSVPTHAQLVTASNTLNTALVANDTTTSNALNSFLNTASNLLRTDFVAGDAVLQGIIDNLEGATNGLDALTRTKQHGSGVLTNLVLTVANNVTNIISLSTSNATSKPLTNSYASGVATLFGLEQGANVTLTPNGSNIVIASTGGGGGTNMMPLTLTISGAAITPTGTLPAGTVGSLEYRVTLTENITLNNPSGTVTDGMYMNIEFLQDGTGSRTVTVGSQYNFGTTIPDLTLSTEPGLMDIAKFRYHLNSNRWDVIGFTRGL